MSQISRELQPFLASSQSTGPKGIQSQEQVQHENAKEHAIPGPTTVPCRYNRQGRKANVGAGTATATEPTREHLQCLLNTMVPWTLGILG